MSFDRPTPLLAGLTPRAFLARHWQKKPLLGRGAVAEFSGVVTPLELISLAGRDDVQARIVMRAGKRWQVHDGPFPRRFFRELDTVRWTLLVHDVNQFVPAARTLLERFDFIPYARLDDLMVSYARPGGGVGPHADSYDVFLLQGLGRRRWQISTQRDVEYVADAPLKLLRGFRPDHEWLLQAGDILYLPPGLAHNGIAVDECMTYSIGFRAPAWRELAEQFLVYLQDRVALDGLYADPNLRPQRRPARIGAEMIEAIAGQLLRLRWSKAEVARFVGCYLTEPKSQVFFTPPMRRLSQAAFKKRVQRHGVALDLKTQMLFTHASIFVNGERFEAQGRVRAQLEKLADSRQLAHPGDSVTLLARLYDWYSFGWLRLNDPDASEKDT